jgi:hypothetical protein
VNPTTIYPEGTRVIISQSGGDPESRGIIHTYSAATGRYAIKSRTGGVHRWVGGERVRPTEKAQLKLDLEKAAHDLAEVSAALTSAQADLADERAAVDALTRDGRFMEKQHVQQLQDGGARLRQVGLERDAAAAECKRLEGVGGAQAGRIDYLTQQLADTEKVAQGQAQAVREAEERAEQLSGDLDAAQRDLRRERAQVESETGAKHRWRERAQKAERLVDDITRERDMAQRDRENLLEANRNQAQQLRASALPDALAQVTAERDQARLMLLESHGEGEVLKRAEVAEAKLAEQINRNVAAVAQLVEAERDLERMRASYTLTSGTLAAQRRINREQLAELEGARADRESARRHQRTASIQLEGVRKLADEDAARDRATIESLKHQRDTAEEVASERAERLNRVEEALLNAYPIDVKPNLTESEKAKRIGAAIIEGFTEGLRNPWQQLDYIENGETAEPGMSVGAVADYMDGLEQADATWEPNPGYDRQRHPNVPCSVEPVTGAVVRDQADGFTFPEGGGLVLGDLQVNVAPFMSREVIEEATQKVVEALRVKLAEQIARLGSAL